MPYEAPGQSPLFHAQQADRYDRQQLIQAYEDAYRCRLLVMIDHIFPDSVVRYEELLGTVQEGQDVQLMLVSPGGDGETAVRLARATHARTEKFIIIVPNHAKSAATILALSADEIMMGPMGDLGPIDPQFLREEDGGRRHYVSAKDIMSAYDEAMERIAGNPEAYPVVAALMGNLTALDIQKARSATERSGQLLREALACSRNLAEDELEDLLEKLSGPLVDEPADHSAVFTASHAEAIGLPIVKPDPRSEQWDMLWRLYAKYNRFVEHNVGIYEGAHVSHVMGPPGI